jgi:hypothetical protein
MLVHIDILPNPTETTDPLTERRARRLLVAPIETDLDTPLRDPAGAPAPWSDHPAAPSPLGVDDDMDDDEAYFLGEEDEDDDYDDDMDDDDEFDEFEEEMEEDVDDDAELDDDDF